MNVGVQPKALLLRILGEGRDDRKPIVTVPARQNRYGFLRREADAKSLLDEAASPQDWWLWERVGPDEVLCEEGFGWATVFGGRMAQRRPEACS